MASTISSIDSSILKLAPTFQTAIKAILDSESTPLKNVQAQKDRMDVRRGIYVDLKANFDALQSSIQALISTQASFGLSRVSKATITSGEPGTTVLSAVATDGVTSADYDISVTKLARAQSRSTVDSFSPEAAAGKSGVFWLGGTGAAIGDRPVIFTPTDTVTGASPTGVVASGQRELGTGLYTLETRDSGGIRQFRLVNADGNAVSILSQSGTSYTSDWQAMTNGNYDTGRGLNLTLNASGTNASTALTYTAAGTLINIGATDSLRTITAAINAASQPEGRDLKALIVANKLVLTSAQTGVNHTMIYTDSAGLGFGADSQPAQNAEFTVNGMAVSRASNSNLNDVVDGATITLGSDAEGKSARLSIAATSDKAAGLVKTMVDKFNIALSHLKDKLASTPTTTNEGKTAYTRGPLTGDTSLSSFRLEMLGRMNRSYTNSGSLKTFSEIGISFDKDTKLTFDSVKFSAVFNSNSSDVTALLDVGLAGINTQVSNYAGSNGTLSRALTSLDDQRTSYDKRIAKYNEVLTARKEALFNQYYGYQNQLVEYGYQQQMFNAMYGTGTNVNSSG